MNTVMAIVILAMAALAAFHFVYTGILLPSIRFSLRLRLYALRDQLRRIQVEDKEAFPAEVFEVLQTGINNSVNLLPRINAFLIHDVAERIKSNAKLKGELASRRAIIEESKDPRVKKIDREIDDVLTKALHYNMLPWSVYLIPLVALVFLLRRLTGQVKEISIIPETKINTVLPPDPVLAVAA